MKAITCKRKTRPGTRQGESQRSKIIREKEPLELSGKTRIASLNARPGRRVRSSRNPTIEVKLAILRREGHLQAVQELRTLLEISVKTISGTKVKPENAKLFLTHVIEGQRSLPEKNLAETRSFSAVVGGLNEVVRKGAKNKGFKDARFPFCTIKVPELVGWILEQAGKNEKPRGKA